MHRIEKPGNVVPPVKIISICEWYAPGENHFNLWMVCPRWKSFQFVNGMSPVKIISICEWYVPGDNHFNLWMVMDSFEWCKRKYVFVEFMFLTKIFEWCKRNGHWFLRIDVFDQKIFSPICYGPGKKKTRVASQTALLWHGWPSYYINFQCDDCTLMLSI